MAVRDRKGWFYIICATWWLSLCLSLSAEAQSLARMWPKHGLEFSYNLYWQLPAQVTSTDGSDGYVSVSDLATGFRVALSYGIELTERTTALFGLQVGSSSFSFTWSGDQTVLGPFAHPGTSSTSLYLDRWETRGAFLGLETAVLQSTRFRVLATVGTQFEAGSGSSGFVVPEVDANGVQSELFRYSAEFNNTARLITGLRVGALAEWTRPNYNRIRLGVGFCAMLSSDNLQGTYFARTSSQGPLHGQFRSSMSNFFLHTGYIFSWGYPKVPKRLRQPQID